MKSKIVILLAALLLSATIFAQEDKTMYVMKNGAIVFEIPVKKIDNITFYNIVNPTYDEGVVINGIRWTTRNVDKPGTFADNPEDAGMFYQWNRNIGWSTTNPLVNSNGGNTWDSSNPTGKTWTTANNVCPAGYHIPTEEEVKSLNDAGYISTTQNGINGRLYGSGENTIFIPASGYRNGSTGRLYSVDSNVSFWSSAYTNNYNAYSVRCVVGEMPTDVTHIILKNAHTLTVGKNYTLMADVMPVEVSDKTVIWTSSDNAIATVDENGKVIAVTAGTAIITAKADNVTATCSVKVVADNQDEEGVLINGVRWATRNVDMPGTFSDNPEDAGMYYQWNRNIGWSPTDPLVNSDEGTSWDSSEPASSPTWEKANDPSPAGWRVPTSTEIQSLLDTDKVSNEWTTEYGISGMRFTDKDNGNSIFLPAVGYRGNDSGELWSHSTSNWYWSNTQYDGRYAYTLKFEENQHATYSQYSSRNIGLPIRCVIE